MKRYIKSSTDNLIYENYGDANFLDGGLLLAEDPSNPNGFYFYKCDFVLDVNSDNHYLLTSGYVDTDDSWIDVDEVERFADCSKETEPARFAEACLNYYGPDNFGGFVPMRGQENYDDELFTAEGVEDYMKDVKVSGRIYFDGE